LIYVQEAIIAIGRGKEAITTEPIRVIRVVASA